MNGSERRSPLGERMKENEGERRRGGGGIKEGVRGERKKSKRCGGGDIREGVRKEEKEGRSEVTSKVFFSFFYPNEFLSPGS